MYVHLLQAIVASGLVGLGVLWVIGARKRWEWLVDPPTHLWFCYLPSLVKFVAGARVLRVWTSIVGVAFIAFGAWMLVNLAAIWAHGAR